MSDTEERSDPMGKVLAWLAYAALGLAAFLNTIIAGMALFTGHFAGAIGEVADKAEAHDVASDANHAALVAKIIAIGFGVLAATEYAAGHFIKRQIRTLFVPIAMAMTVAGELGFSIWSKAFNALDAVIIACALFATWVWVKLPKRATV